MTDDHRSRRLVEHYENRDEDSRLSRTNSHRTEFLTTDFILQRYVPPGSSILDIGAGTGRYSLHYANLGHKVVARDFVEHNINILRANPLCTELGVDAGVGDATDLSEFADETFDVVLCHGPLYHVGEYDGRQRCIAECLRVLKADGVLSVAYISKFYVFVEMVRRNREFLSDKLRGQVMCNETVLKDDPGNLWFFDSPQEIEALFSGFLVERLAHAGTDGIAILMADVVDSFDDEQYEQWLRYHYATCEEPSLLGYSNHLIYVCRKGEF